MDKAESQEVPFDQPCVRCGYSLRGLSANSLCPECSTPIERSLLGDRIVFSDPEYVRALRLGTWLVFGSLIVLVLLPFATAFGKLALSGTSYVTDGVYLLATALFLWGWWNLTRPDLGQLTTNKGEGPRRRTRIAVSVLVGTKLAVLALPHAMMIPGPLMIAIKAVDRISLCLGLVAGMQYIQWLAPRLPSERVLKSAGKLIKAPLIVACLFLLYHATELWLTKPLGIAAGSLGDQALRMANKVGRVGANWGTIYCFLYLWPVFNHLRKELNRISKAQEGPPPAVSGGAETTQEAVS